MRWIPPWSGLRLDPALACRDYGTVVNIFISYTRTDRDWAFWLATELKELGHAPRIHEWEIKGGSDIYAWMVTAEP